MFHVSANTPAGQSEYNDITHNCSVLGRFRRTAPDSDQRRLVSPMTIYQMAHADDSCCDLDTFITMPVLLARPLQYKSPMITRLRYQSVSLTTLVLTRLTQRVYQGVFAPFCVFDQTSGWSAAGGSASVLDIAEEREVSNASASRTSSQVSQQVLHSPS